SEPVTPARVGGRKRSEPFVSKLCLAHSKAPTASLVGLLSAVGFVAYLDAGSFARYLRPMPAARMMERDNNKLTNPAETPRRPSSLLLWRVLLLGQVRDQFRVVLRPLGDLDHGDPHLGREELLRVGPLVDVARAPAVVLHHQVHLLDPLLPDDAVVLPEVGHLHVPLVHALLLVDLRARAAVPGLQPLVRDVAQRPGGRRAAVRLLDHLGPDVDRTVPVVDRRRP